MAEKIEVNVKRQVVIEEVDGGLFFVGDGTSRKAATSSAALFKLLTDVLGLQKQKRGPRKAKEEKPAKK
jgi:hypothetical protein